MKQPVVIDSNVFFSSLRTGSKARLFHFFESNTDLTFYAPNFLVVETFKHRERLRAKSKLTESEFLEVLQTIVQHLRFFNEDMISTENLIYAWRLVSDIDPKDHLFVALALELDAKLWTRDIVLKGGLMKKGFDNFFNENQ